jgi:hypothetical protein
MKGRKKNMEKGEEKESTKERKGEEKINRNRQTKNRN